MELEEETKNPFYQEGKKSVTTIHVKCIGCGKPFIVNVADIDKCNPKLLNPKTNPFFDRCDDCLEKFPPSKIPPDKETLSNQVRYIKDCDASGYPGKDIDPE